MLGVVLCMLVLGASAALERRVVYTTNWSQYRSGSVAGTQCRWTPSSFPPNLATHLVYSFAAISGTGYSVITTEDNDVQMYAEMQALKARNPKLKTLIALGGWSFSDPGPTRSIFNNLVASRANRAAFIPSLLAFTAKYGFDGVDFDWEYPGTPDRGGRPSDKAGYSALIAELRAAATAAGRPNFLITMAVASCPYGCEGTDVQAIAPHIDWFNVMSYEYWGPWSPLTGDATPWVTTPQGKNYKTSVSTTLDYYLVRNKVPPSKITLGLAFWGRAWYLRSSAPGQGVGAAAKAFEGPKGQCTGQAGFLAWYEIKQLIAQGAKVTINARTKSAYLQLQDIWVSFDLPQTMYMKIQAAKALNISGLMAWAADLDDGSHTLMRLMQTQADPGPWADYRTYALQIVLSEAKTGGKALARLGNWAKPSARRAALAKWNAPLSGIGVDGLDVAATPNSLVLTWVSKRSGADMAAAAKTRFAPGTCPKPTLSKHVNKIQALLKPLALKVEGFTFMAPADKLQASFVMPNCKSTSETGGNSTSTDKAQAAAAPLQRVAAALPEAQAVVEAQVVSRATAAPGTSAVQWAAQLRGVRGGKH